MKINCRNSGRIAATLAVVSVIFLNPRPVSAQFNEVSEGYAFETPGFFDIPSAVAYDNLRNHLALADLGRDLVYDFDLTDRTWNTYGENFNITRPLGLAFGPDGSLYIIMENLPLILRFNQGANRPDTIDLVKANKGRDIIPKRIFVGVDKSIYLIDSKEAGVCKLDENGQMIMEFTDGLDHPDGITVSSDGEIYVTDKNSDPVTTFTSEGDLIGRLTRPEPPTAKLKITGSGIAVDRRGWIYIIDKSAEKLIWYDPTGVLTGNWAPSIQPFFPVDLAIDKQDRIYVLESGARRVMILEREF